MDLIEQQHKYFTRFNKDKKVFEQVCYYTGKTTPLATPTNNLADVHRYDKDLAQAICGLVRSGNTLAQIGRMPGFPLQETMYNWKRLFPGFEEMLEAAIKDRAYHFQDKIIDELDELGSLSKDEVPAKKLQIDTTFKLMEKANPEKFGNNLKISGDVKAPLQFVVDTGVRRQGDDGFDQEKFDAIDASFKKVQNEGSSGDEAEDSIGRSEHEGGSEDNGPSGSVESLAEEIGKVASGRMGEAEQIESSD